jgi:hypothetical protein
MAMYPCLDPLTQAENKMQHLTKYLDISILTSRVRALDLHQVPPQGCHPKVIMEGGLTHVHVGCELIPLFCNALWGDMELCPIDHHETVVEHVVFFTVKVNLRQHWEGGEHGGEDNE